MVCYHTAGWTMHSLHTCLISGQSSIPMPLSTLSSARSTSILHMSTRLHIEICSCVDGLPVAGLHATS
jgi:hypothetical protein